MGIIKTATIGIHIRLNNVFIVNNKIFLHLLSFETSKLFPSETKAKVKLA